MSIGIRDDQMNCNATGHTAHRGESGWQVSWLPGRTLTRDEAITALTLSEVAARSPKPGDRIWPFIEGWAHELGLPDPAGALRQTRARDADREAGG